MAACDIIVQPAYREPLARVGVEAQSVGAALMVSDDGGLKEVVRDGEDGFVLPADDFAAWTALAAALIDSPARRAAIGQAARAAADRLTLERHIAGVEAAYARAGLRLPA
jgi:glycosyltransferase involved in cell wall biosynthesis